jgi:MFS family permease
MPRSVTSTTLRALRHRNFQLFFAGQLISLIGTWMQYVAQSWLVYRISGSSALLGLVSFAGQIPVFGLSPIGGYTADRWSRRTVIVTQSVSMVLALVLALLTLTDRVQIWEIFILASLLGVVNAFDIPARQSFLVEMVGREDMINAIALNSSMFNGARIVGPAIAGILVAKIGEGWCFFANGISYIAVICGLFMMRMTPFIPPKAEGSAFESIREGFHYVGRTKPVLAFLLLVGILSFAGLPYLVLMPIFADGILHAGASGLGILMGLAGLGALIGALTLAARTALTGLSRAAAISLMVFGGALIAFSFSRNLWFSCAMLVVIGYTGMIQMGASNTLVQSMVPDVLRGRVMSVYSMMYMGVGPVGALIAGVAADKFGAPRTLAAGGVCCLLASGLFAWQLESIRKGAGALIRIQREAQEAINPAR